MEGKTMRCVIVVVLLTYVTWVDAKADLDKPKKNQIDILDKTVEEVLVDLVERFRENNDGRDPTEEEIKLWIQTFKDATEQWDCEAKQKQNKTQLTERQHTAGQPAISETQTAAIEGQAMALEGQSASVAGQSTRSEEQPAPCKEQGAPSEGQAASSLEQPVPVEETPMLTIPFTGQSIPQLVPARSLGACKKDNTANSEKPVKFLARNFSDINSSAYIVLVTLVGMVFLMLRLNRTVLVASAEPLLAE